MAKSAPAFQFYAQDFFMGTADLSAAARGCYISMMCMSWTKGPIADNLNAIAKAMSLGPTDPPFADLWAEIKGKWTLGPDGWTNARLEEIREAQKLHSQRQSERGKAGGKATAIARAEAETIAVAEAEGQAQVGLQPQPEGSSSFFDLHSSSSPSSSLSTLPEHVRERKRYGPPIVGGPLEHRAHGWCNNRGLCLPANFYAKLLRKLGKHREAEFREWLGSVIDALGDTPVGDNLFDFWENHFTAWVGTVTAKPSTAKETAGVRLQRVGAEYLKGEVARREARPEVPSRPVSQIAGGE